MCLSDVVRRRKGVQDPSGPLVGAPGSAPPRVVSNRIIKRRGCLQAEVVDGTPNAETLVEPLGTDATGSRPPRAEPISFGCTWRASGCRLITTRSIRV